MFDMSWGEILVIGGVALVAIGPKELPRALRTFGQVVGKVSRMAGEFRAQFNEAMREADLEELRKSATDINDAVTPFKSQFDPLKSAGEQLQKAIGISEPPLAEPTETGPIAKSIAPPAVTIPETQVALPSADQKSPEGTVKKSPVSRKAEKEASEAKSSVKKSARSPGSTKSEKPTVPIRRKSNPAMANQPEVVADDTNVNGKTNRRKKAAPSKPDENT